MIKKILLTVIIGLTGFLLVSCSKEKMKPVEDSLVPYIDDEWVAVWADEFNGTELDMNKWTYEIDGNGGGNNELQYYTNKNTLVNNGTLKIIAKKENISGRQYSSSRIVTKYKGDFKYGRIVASAKMPSGKGTWPAIWMMPTNSKYGVWPNSGEIDIMEYVGYDPNVFHTSIHTKKYNHMLGTQQTYKKNVANAETEFHTFEIIWEPGKIESFVNGEKYGTFKYTSAYNQEVESKDAFPFDQEFFLIMNLAIGGSWGGAQGVDDNIFPATFEIDYIRVYQKDYNYYDSEKPSDIKNLRQSTRLQNSIFWNEATDDMGVSYYNIYVDGILHTTSELSQVVLKDLDKGLEYSIEVEAVDFVGNKSSKSEPLKFTFK
ncbi:glycoside hydrolase family 16 protein [Haploplasma axanthum]|uniref:Beta-glucanase n=1 Tax=Haploplasma axanthum TaxID=29552 RepID=A0A449BE39_HAPAX|nr:glycoside hydrolase family 16 protein [Haploplasma axanthum]VEU80723.1 Beta-glucanase precursor [Haploplasma axanthum]